MTTISSINKERQPAIGRDFPLAERSTDLIALVDQENRVRYTNLAYTKNLGYSKRDLLGKDFNSIYKEMYTSSRESSNNVIGKLKSKTGEWCWIETSTFHFPWKEHDYVAYFSRDITLSRKLETELEKTKKESDDLISIAPLGISKIDLVYPKFSKVNETICRITGYSREELLKMSPYDLFDEASKAKFKDRIKVTVSDKASKELEDYRIVRKDGTTLHFILSIQITFEDGKAVGAYVIGMDVTERHKMEEKLLISEQRYKVKAAQLETILNNTPALIWMTDDRYGRNIIGNEAANEFLGVSRNINISKSGSGNTAFTKYEVIKEGNIIRPPDMPIQKVARTGIPLFDYEMDIMFENKVVTTLMGNIVPFVDLRNKPSGAVGVFIDISERKKLEQQKDEFLAVASHELKTPITSLKAYNQFLMALFTKRDEADLLVYLNKMNSQINKLTLLVNELLDITGVQIKHKGMKLNLDNFYFDSLVKDAVEQIQLTSVQHRLETHLDKNVSLYGDRERIQQVIFNLLTNAIKYSPHADRIVVTTKATSDTIIFSVQDFGIGISEENKARIFERFYRVTSRKKETYPGLGLGLYICKEIINQHDGKIWLESIEGKGSTFYFSLPLTNTLFTKNKGKPKKDRV